MSFMMSSLHQNSGSYGLQKADWSAIKKTLKTLGGKYHRTTNKEFTDQFIMPTGHQIAVGRSNSGHDDIKEIGLKQLMEEVIKARVEPMLFLALLSAEGAAWHSKPPVVTKLEKYLISHKPDLSSPESWRGVIKMFAVEARKQEELKSKRPVKQDQSEFKYDIKQAIDLLELPTNKKESWYKRIRQGIKNKKEVFDLLQTGNNLKIEQKTKREFFYVSEAGALIIAEHIAKEVGIDTKTPTPSPVLNAKAEAAPLSAGQALMRLSNKYNIELKWKGDQALTVDHEQFLIDLAGVIGE